MLAAVKQDGSALEYAAKSLKADREVVLAAVKQDKNALDHASEALQKDEELLKIAGIKSVPIKYSVELYVHGGQQLIGKMFDSARRKAPSILFIDELDALAPSRERFDVGHHYRAEVNELLVQLNECSKKGILVIGATNFISNIDKALQRPGRIDKKIFIGPPDFEARYELFQIYLKERPLKNIDWARLAEETEIYTCAEIEELANESARIALADRRNIETQDIINAKKIVTPSLTAEEVEKMRG